MENTNLINKRIEQRANERFENDINSLSKLMDNNAIGRRLLINGEKFAHTGMWDDSAFFNSRGFTNNTIKNTNIAKIKEELIAQYIKEETDSLLSKLDMVADFINQQG